MRILFSSLTAYGHFYPLVPLAVAARNAGHDVAFATGSEFHPTLARLGLTPITSESSPGLAFREDPEFADPATMSKQQLARVQARTFGHALPNRVFADLGAVLREERFDLVVHEAGNPGAGLAAASGSIPALCHGYGVAGFNEDILAVLARFGTDVGLPLRTWPTHHLGNPYIDICPPSVQEPEYRALRRRIELRPVPFSEDGELPAGVTERDRPLVFLTLGTAFGTADLLRTVLEGLAGLDVRVLVTTGPVEVAELGTVPANVTAVPWVDQARVWEHVDLTVHHGGAGTTFNAMGAGVKQLVLPQGADQFRNAGVVQAAGVGRQLLGEQLTADAIRTEVGELLVDDRTEAAVDALAKEVAAMPGPEDLAARLPEFAAET